MKPALRLVIPLLLAALASCEKKSPDPGPTPILADSSRASPTAPNALTSATTSAAPLPVSDLPPARVVETPLPVAVFHVSKYDPMVVLAAGPSPDEVKLRLFDVGGKMVVAPSFRLLEGGALSDESVPGFEPSEFPGGDYKDRSTGGNWLRVKEIMGSYPDDLWVSAHGEWGIVAPRADYPVEHDYVWQRMYGHWGRVKDYPLAASPWSHGRTLAFMATGGFALARPQKGKLAELPKQAKRTSGAARVSVVTMTALRSGEVVVLGTDGDASGRLALETWDGDEGDALGASRVLTLSTPEETPQRAWLFASKGRAIVVASYRDSAFAAEIVGDKPKRIALPASHIDAAHLAADGTLVVASGTDVYRHEGGGAFARAALPAKLKEITGLFAESKDRLYITAWTEAGASVLLWTGESKEELPPPPAASAAPAPQGSAAVADDLLKTFPALQAGCATPFVVFFPVSKATSKDFAFPQTRATLKDFPALAKLRVIDFKAASTRFVGAAAPDLETATALVEHWNRRDEKSKARPACFAPPEDARVLLP